MHANRTYLGESMNDLYIIIGNDISEEVICEWISEEKSRSDRYQFAFSKF